MIIQGARSDEPDASLIKVLIKAHEFWYKLVNGDGSSIAELAKREGVTGSYVTRLVRLTFLAPDIVKDILDGRHPPTVNAAKLLKDTRLPLDVALGSAPMPVLAAADRVRAGHVDHRSRCTGGRDGRLCLPTPAADLPRAGYHDGDTRWQRAYGNPAGPS